jgi:hypothetical protein
VPALFTATWLHLDDRHCDGAAVTATASGLYAFMARHRRQPGGLRAKFSLRGGVRGAAVVLAIVNSAAGSLVWLTRTRAHDERERRENDRWGKEAAHRAASSSSS